MCRVTRELPAPIKVPSLQMALPGSITPPGHALQPSTTKEVLVKTAEHRFESKQAFASRGSNIYEMGPVLRDGKFGSIQIASILKPSTKENEFERAAEKPVVLKIYSMEQMKDIQGNAMENPWREIEIQQMIGQQQKQCPHLVGIRETCIIEHNLLIVLPFYNGGDLLDCLETRYQGAFPVFQAKKMFQQICSGLQFLHKNGIAHRDLSLENILYDESTDCYAICDFGVSIRLPTDPSTGAFLPLTNAPVCGKDGYIAPELWRRETCVDLCAADIWSMGVVLFMVLTGSAPLQRAVEWDPYYQTIVQKQFLGMFSEMMEVDEGLRGGLELVSMILEPNPVMRPTVSDLLTHSWLN
jgi:serine/threonine protein kinase